MTEHDQGSSLGATATDLVAAQPGPEAGALPVGRCVPVKYNFSGALREMQQTFPLAPDERQVKAGVIAVRQLAIGAGPGLVSLTDRRLCLLIHYAFRFDRGREFARGSIVAIHSIKLLPTIWYLRVTYRTAQGFAHIDITDVQVRPAATARMGPTVTLERLFEALDRAWGSDAPPVSM